jgi:hypothetical protein
VSLPRSAILPLARAYAGHSGAELDPEDVGRRLDEALEIMGPRGRALAAAGALFVRWAAPLLLLGRPRRFDGLSEQAREALLARLQCARGPVLRGLFLGIKPVLTAVCYG